MGRLEFQRKNLEGIQFSGRGEVGSGDRDSESRPKPSLSFFVDKMVLVRLNLQGVAPGLNEFSGVEASW